MKVKLLLALSLFANQYSFSQSEKYLNGKVYNDNFLMSNVDIINKSSKKYATTNTKGEFAIHGKVNDSIIVYVKDYYLKKLKLTKELIDLNYLEINLTKKPEELDEVVITKMPSIKLSKDKNYEQGKLDEYALEKRTSALTNSGLSTGGIPNGMNLLRIAGMLVNLFKEEKSEVKKNITIVEFPALAKKNCKEEFFTKNLKVKVEDINLFLQFCDADPQSKKISANYNILSMMDFLTFKSIEFKNLPTSK